MKKKTLEESIIDAMEDTDVNLIKYYPYILQDFWELGTPADEIIKIIKRHKNNFSSLSVLDLGSGKGAVSVKIASELKCKCLGIDAIKDYVLFANNKAKEYSVENICTFENNDIRTRIKTLQKYDIIILGAIGPVFGDYCETLTQLSFNLNKDGLIIINDGYIEDGNKTDYPNVFHKSSILKQINKAGMVVIDSITGNENPEINGNIEQFEHEVKNIEKRCTELIEKYPEDKVMFLEYVKNQTELYRKLTDEVESVIMVIKKPTNKY